MKKYVALLLAVVLALSLVGCAKPDEDVMTLKELNSFRTEKGYTAEWFLEDLEGIHLEDIHQVWGKPDGTLSGFWGESWYLDETKTAKVTLYYDADGRVETLRLEE